MSTPIVMPQGTGEVLQVASDRIRVLADGAATNGAAFAMENLSAPGSGPPLHRHAREDEHFYVIEGHAKFVVNGVEHRVAAGGYAFAPRGSVHTFVSVGPGPLRMLVVCTPAGLEAPFRQADRLAREGAATPDSLARTFAPFGIEFLGPPLSP